MKIYDFTIRNEFYKETKVYVQSLGKHALVSIPEYTWSSLIDYTCQTEYGVQPRYV